MTAKLLHHKDEKYLEVFLSGRLERKDYESLGPEVDRLAEEQGRLRMLVELHDFHGWTFGGLWEDIKFDAKHFNDIEKLAIVGEKAWHKGMAVFCKPFTTAKVRYFDVAETGAAREWLTGKDDTSCCQPVEQKSQMHQAATT